MTTAALEYAAANNLSPLTEAEIRNALGEVQQGKIPARQRDLQLMLLITYADERCNSFVLTEEGRAWLAGRRGLGEHYHDEESLEDARDWERRRML